MEGIYEEGVVCSSGERTAVDAVVWCPGFGPVLDHLSALGLVGADGKIEVEEGEAGTRSVGEPRRRLVGYRERTGYAWATLIGVGRSARAAVEEISEVLGNERARPVAVPVRGRAR